MTSHAHILAHTNLGHNVTSLFLSKGTQDGLRTYYIKKLIIYCIRQIERNRERDRKIDNPSGHSDNLINSHMPNDLYKH